MSDKEAQCQDSGLCTQDEVAVHLSLLEKKGTTDVMACSTYFQGDTDQVLPNTIRQIIDYCCRNQHDLIIGCMLTHSIHRMEGLKSMAEVCLFILCGGRR